MIQFPPAGSSDQMDIENHLILADSALRGGRLLKSVRHSTQSQVFTYFVLPVETG
jgi:hypothetical protein